VADKDKEVKEVRAIAKYIRMSPKKVAIVLDLIRNKSVKEAKAILEFTNKDAVYPVAKLLKSAIANAEYPGNDLDVNRLYVSETYVGPGPILKRMQPHAKGRAFRINKRSSHITLKVKER